MRADSGGGGADDGEALGFRTLIFLATRPEAMERFFAMSGVGADEVRARAAEPEFLGFVLDFLLSDESLLLEFCAEAKVRPDAPMRARAGLPGGDAPNWT